MGWKGEFGTKWDMPGLLDFLVQELVVEDLSWHNDMSPSFGVYDDKTEKEVRLWVGHPIREYREFGGDRFIVTAGHIGGEMDVEDEFPELEAALRKLFGLLVKYHQEGGAPVTARKRWRPESESEMWDDPAYYLETLIEEFYTGHNA
jgi:hypothetical protein